MLRRSLIHQGPARASLRSLSASDIVCLISLFWFASYADQYLFSVGGPPPLVGQLVCVTSISAVVFYRAVLAVPVWRERSARFKKFAIIMIVYALWTLICYMYSSQDEVVTELLIARIKAVVLILLFAYVLDHERLAVPFAKGCAVLACAGALLNVQDFVSPTFSTVPGRAAGLYLNPTISGFMIIALGAVGIRSAPLAARYVLWPAICVGVLLTFSRAAWLYVMISTIGLAWLGVFGFGRVRLLFSGSICLVVGAFGYLFVTGQLADVIALSPLGGYLDANTLNRLGASGSIVGDFSSFERESVVRLGMEYFGEAPLIGQGLGFTHEWRAAVSTHNMYILWLAEGGIIGFTVYIALVLFLWNGALREQWVVAIIFLVAGVFTHNLLDAAGEGVVIAFLGASAGRRVLK